jgi:hypothetical protein
MRCKTGTCVYNDTSIAPGPPRPKPPPPPVWPKRMKHQEAVALAFVALGVMGAFIAAASLIRNDARKANLWLQARCYACVFWSGR